MKKVLSLGLVFLFSGLLFASNYESPYVDEKNNEIVLVDNFNTSEFVNVDSEFVNPNFSEDIEITIKEAYADSSYNAIFYKHEYYVSNEFNVDYGSDDWNIIVLSDNDLDEPNSFEHEDPGETNKATYENLTDYSFNKNPSESPPKLE